MSVEYLLILGWIKLSNAAKTGMEERRLEKFRILRPKNMLLRNNILYTFVISNTKAEIIYIWRIYIYFDQKLIYKIKTKLICISADNIFVIILKSTHTIFIIWIWIFMWEMYNKKKEIINNYSII